MTATTTKAQDLRQALEYFMGTENYYFNELYPTMNYTDGVKFLADEAGAYWLLDIIGTEFHTHQRRKLISNFVTIKLNVTGNSATLTHTDGNYVEYETREIEYTDFPEGEWELWLIDGVLLLPSEY